MTDMYLVFRILVFEEYNDRQPLMPDKQQCDPDACLNSNVILMPVSIIHGVNSSNFHIQGRFILNYVFQR